MKPLIVVLALIMAGCKPQSATKVFVPPKPDDRLITFGEYSNLEMRVSSIEFANIIRDEKWVHLDATSKGYQKIDTPLVPLLISVRDLTQYLDGYKMTIEIGNPYSMDFNGLHVSYKWGIPYKVSNGIVINDTEAKSSQKTKDADLTDVLRSGWWNPIELTVTPATPEEIKNLTILVAPNIISLYRKPRVQP